MTNGNDQDNQRPAPSTPRMPLPIERQPGLGPIVGEPIMLTVFRNGHEITAEVADDQRHAVIVGARMLLGLEEFMIGDQLIATRI